MLLRQERKIGRKVTLATFCWKDTQIRTMEARR